MKEPETGKKENTGKSGYSITTWRLHLWCRHPEWLRTTQEFYNRIAEFYYNLLLDHTDLWEMGSQQTLRELEIMSIPGRGGRIPSDPLPWQKVVLDGTGQEIAVKFWKGGKEYSHYCRKLLEKIQKSQEATGGRQTGRVDCWFGRGELPEKAKQCIESWKKFCPDYEIKEWNEDNFDMNSCAYVKEAYEAKKWAFVSDYARFEILYKYGGLYFDTDVELVKSFDDMACL